MFPNQVCTSFLRTGALSGRFQVIELLYHLPIPFGEKLVSRDPSIPLVIQPTPLDLVLERLLELLTSHNELSDPNQPTMLALILLDQTSSLRLDPSLPTHSCSRMAFSPSVKTRVTFSRISPDDVAKSHRYYFTQSSQVDTYDRGRLGNAIEYNRWVFSLNDALSYMSLLIHWIDESQKS